MPLKYWLQFSVLTIALSATLASIFLLKQGHMSQFWTSLGFSHPEKRLNWCEERVSSIYFYDSQAKILEEKNKWVWQSQKSSAPNVLLNYLDVEKWFAKYCQLPVQGESQDMEPGGVGTPLFEVVFINGNRLSVQSVDEENFKIHGKIYRSPTLRKAFKELLAFGPKIE